MTGAAFAGFPGIARGTAIPNLFFETVLPGITSSDALLAFLWVARIAQDQDNEAHCATQEDIWARSAARRSFETLGTGRPGLAEGLSECVGNGSLLSLRLDGAQEVEAFFVNNPRSRRVIARARAGQLVIRPGVVVVDPPAASPPGIFRLYEEQIGTITPMVAERLLEIADTYSPDWIADAFRESALRSVRNLRYVERILETWAQEGRANEGTAPDSLADRKRKYVDGRLGPGGRPA